MSKVKITEVSFGEFTDIEFKPPSSFYIRDCLGVYNFFHTKDRSLAQETVNSIYGVGHYTVIAAKIIKSKGELSVTGTASRRK